MIGLVRAQEVPLDLGSRERVQGCPTGRESTDLFFLSGQVKLVFPGPTNAAEIVVEWPDHRKLACCLVAGTVIQLFFN